MKLNWLDRTIIISPVYYTLATSKKILDAELKRFKIDVAIGLNVGAGATTNFLHNERGDTCAIVCLYNHDFDQEQIYSLLVHEAVHIFQEIKNKMGEKEPSSEFEAYSVQGIAQNLFYEYKRQMKGKHGKQTNRRLR